MTRTKETEKKSPFLVKYKTEIMFFLLGLLFGMIIFIGMWNEHMEASHGYENCFNQYEISYICEYVTESDIIPIVHGGNKYWKCGDDWSVKAC